MNRGDNNCLPPVWPLANLSSFCDISALPFPSLAVLIQPLPWIFVMHDEHVIVHCKESPESEINAHVI